MIDIGHRSTALAVRLARAGARFVVVGGTARRLGSGAGLPADLDVVVAPADAPELWRQLQAMRGAHREPYVKTVTAQHLSRVDTWLGPVDVFVGRARRPVTDVVVEGQPLSISPAQPA